MSMSRSLNPQTFVIRSRTTSAGFSISLPAAPFLPLHTAVTRPLGSAEKAATAMTPLPW